ncbi:MAG: CopG family transcriptional regulator [Rivularia sp. (in: Bacteria)]|nr:CopG family transcriptional regulator [Rivularia sp. MS3]
MHEIHGYIMPRKITTEPIKRLTIELPESEYRLLEEYCIKKQHTKRQVIRYLIQQLKGL